MQLLKPIKRCVTWLIGVQDKPKNLYRGYKIEKNPFTWMDDEWMFSHEDYEGPTDNRMGTAASVEDCKAEIDSQVERGPS